MVGEAFLPSLLIRGYTSNVASLNISPITSDRADFNVAILMDLHHKALFS